MTLVQSIQKTLGQICAQGLKEGFVVKQDRAEQDILTRFKFDSKVE
jgi:hypothetical protein